jgi:DNA polymerase-4
VLPPDERHDEAARSVLVCLLHKAAVRLRSLGYWCGGMVLSVSHLGSAGWQVKKRFTLCRDTLTLVHVFGELWSQRRRGTPLKVGVVLDHLVDQRNATMPLFEEEQKLSTLADTMDQLNQRFGKHAIYFGGMHGAQAHAGPKIAFGNIPDDV